MTNTLHACINTREKDWQIISPFLQPGLLDNFDELKRVDIIKWALQIDFPLDLTRTCTNSTAEACLNCDECKEREETIIKAKDS